VPGSRSPRPPPGIEERGEQPPEDHCVGDVVDLELVEAQQRRLAGDVGGDLVDGFLGPGAALPFDAVVHFEHEGMEVNPPLARARHRAEEQIHQHRLAASDGSAQVEPERDLEGAVGAEAKAGEPAVEPGLRLIMEQRAVKTLELFDRQLLRRVGLQDPLSAQFPIERDRLVHRGRGARLGNRQRHAGAKAQSHGLKWRKVRIRR
jgi:hypothetical protein